ncbi:MAG TPA: LysE family translocator [Acidimicrobiales bacterium]|nr:LysE family translocator [Acidimicrobiales bacterium]
MVPTGHLLTFFATVGVLIVASGSSVLFVVHRALTFGRRAGLATVAGNATGVYLQVVAVASGIRAIVEQSIAVFTIIKFFGAAYLIFLGIQALRHRRARCRVLETTPEPRTARRQLRDAFVVGVANPKTVVLFAAILPEFVDRPAGDVSAQLLVLGTIFVAMALVSDATWTLAAGGVRTWLGRTPRWLELVGALSGIAIIGIGPRLALAGRRD